MPYRSLRLTDRLGLAFFGLLALLMAGLLFKAVLAPSAMPAPYAFTAQTYVPERSVLCPGDTVRWTPGIIIRRGPAITVISTTLYHVSEPRGTVIPQDSGDRSAFVWLVEDVGRVLYRPREFALPRLVKGRSLPSGKYQIRVGLQDVISAADAYSVPFTIPRGCPGS